MMTNKHSRPVLDLPRTSLEHALEAMAVAGVIGGFAVVVSVWSKLPEKIPTHFSFGGQPDAWGSPIMLWTLPCVSAGMYGLLTIISRYPHKFNYLHPITTDNAGGHYRLARELLLWLKVQIVGLFAWLTWQVCDIALDRTTHLNALFTPLLLGGIALTLMVYVVRAMRLERSSNK